MKLRERRTPGGGAVPAVPTGYTELDRPLGADKPFNGKRVTIQTQWIGGEGADFDAAVADFEAATGIDVVQESIASQHEVVLRSRIEGKTPPDLAMLAQPAAIVEYGNRGLTTDVGTIMDPAKLNEEFPSSFGTKLFSGDDGEIYAVPFKVDVKSTIWYPIKAFEAAGYAVPTTWDEMKALEAKIVADGNGSPWCLGIKDGAATGWIATDWLEDVMLRTAGLEAYQKWTSRRDQVRFAGGPSGPGRPEGSMVHGRIRQRRLRGDHGNGPARGLGPDVRARQQLGRLHARMLDAPPGDVARTQLLPRQACQRRSRLRVDVQAR